MKTERYKAIYYGLDANYHTLQNISQAWNSSASKVNEENNIIVSGQLYTTYFLDHENMEKISGSLAFGVAGTRNPIKVPDEEAYWESFSMVAIMVRILLGYPIMLITETDIDFFEESNNRL
jgi:hypothetical protein